MSSLCSSFIFIIYLSLQVGCQENHFRKRSLKKLKFQWKLKSIANINVDVVCTSFYEWAPILKIILESGLAPPFCLPRQSQDISSAPNGRHALHPEIKRRQQISLESLIERGYTPISPLGIWKRKKTPGIDVYRAVENAYRKNLHDIGNPNSCWKLHRTTDLMRNIPTCTSVCRLFQISKRKWISTTYDTWGTYIGNQIPQSSRGGYYYLRTLV